MKAFKPGDRVVRDTANYHGVRMGKVYTVAESSEGGTTLVGIPGEYITGSFTLCPSVPRAADMLLSADPVERKGTPITTGVLDYFPQALAYVARVSKAGNDQHNPGQPLHWAKGKSMDHADCIARHLVDRNTLDSDNLAHAGKLAWRALALLQTMIDEGKMPKENKDAV